MRVEATVRRDWARARRERTWLAEVSGMILTSVTVVRPDLSCLISCFFLSNSPLPSKSLMVSLYCKGSDGENVIRLWNKGAYNF